MADIPPEGPARADLARVRAQLTSLVERRLTFGLTPDEEAEYRRLTELERELLPEPGALPDERDDAPGPAGT